MNKYLLFIPILLLLGCTCRQQSLSKRVAEQNYVVDGDTFYTPDISIRKLEAEEEQAWIKPLQAMEVPENRSDINVYIKYSSKIDGYTVTCRFMPYGSDVETGYALVRFCKGDSVFVYVDEHWTDAPHMDELLFSEPKWSWADNGVYEFNYIPPTFPDGWKKLNNNSLLGFYTPFQFLDIDFDGEKELLVNDFYQGKDCGNNYKTYKIRHKILLPLYGKTPFSEITNLTEIDTVNERLITKWNADAFHSGCFCFNKKKDDCSIETLPVFHNKDTEDIVGRFLEDTDMSNLFSIDSVSEIAYDTLFEYRRRGACIELVNKTIAE